MLPLNHSPAYAWLMLAGIFVSVFFWSRLASRDERLFQIYMTALAGAFIGAKLVYLVAEGWLHWHDPQRWQILATGKSITGALLGGYVAVECAKKYFGYTKATGDWFALIVPVGIMLGRIGCFLNGCCLGKVCDPAWYTLNDAQGITRWPAVPLEFFFNLLLLGAAFLLRSKPFSKGQLFHLYLIAYGIFRFSHEFLRDTPPILLGLSGYQYAAITITLLGGIGFWLRNRKRSIPVWSPAQIEPKEPQDYSLG